MRHLRRTATTAAAAAVALAVTGLTGCGAPGYTYAADSSDQAYFKVPAGWLQVSPAALANAQSRAYDPAADPSATDLLAGSKTPVVYASVQNLRDSLRAELSFNFMRDLLLPVTSGARQEASAEGEKLTGFSLVSSTTITGSDGVHGINELFEYDVGGQPDAFDQTVLTNGATTKLYLLLVQCFQSCFVAHAAQIRTVVDSFTVRGS
jgi:hypothetical protein